MFLQRGVVISYIQYSILKINFGITATQAQLVPLRVSQRRTTMKVAVGVPAYSSFQVCRINSMLSVGYNCALVIF